MVYKTLNIIKQSYQFSSGLVNAIQNNVDESSFYKELTGIMSEESEISDSLLPDGDDLSELPTLCGNEVSETDDSTSQDEDSETEEVEDDIIFDLESCYECEDRENCAHYLGMTGASEEEIEKAKAKSIFKNPLDKYKNSLQEQINSSLSTLIIYNYNIICPDIEKKTKRDK